MSLRDMWNQCQLSPEATALRDFIEREGPSVAELMDLAQRDPASRVAIEELFACGLLQVEVNVS